MAALDVSRRSTYCSSHDSLQILLSIAGEMQRYKFSLFSFSLSFSLSRVTLICCQQEIYKPFECMPTTHSHKRQKFTRTHTSMYMYVHFCTKMNTCCLTKECENERACLQTQPAASKFVEYVRGREETANVRYACIPSATTTTTTKYTVESCLAADSCSPNAVVFRRSLRLRERE